MIYTEVTGLKTITSLVLSVKSVDEILEQILKPGILDYEPVSRSIWKEDQCSTSSLCLGLV